jgi:arylsulfatase A-like enzyme
VTLAERLKTAGYRTFFAGKWHLGRRDFWPDRQGFDVNQGGHHVGSPPGGYYVPYKNPALPDGPAGEYLTDRLTDEAIGFLESGGSAGRPFFIFLSFYTVHTPIQACRRHIERFQAKADALPESPTSDQIPEGDGFTKIRQDNPAYASMIFALDENVGRLLSKLQKLDLVENTVVIFTSDNGGRSTLFRRGHPTSNLPLRAGKGWCYEGGIRVPLIIRAPGITKAGRICAVPVISTDFYPTMLELAGLRADPEQPADGLSLVPLLRGRETLSRPALYWHYPHYHGSAWKPGAAIRQGSWKLVEFYEDNQAELYNLAEDAGELKELSQSHPDKKAELLRNLRAWQMEVGAKMPRVR